MLTDIPRDVALAILDLVSTNDRVKLALHGNAWRELALAKTSSMAISIGAQETASRVRAMDQWMAERGTNSSKATYLTDLTLSAENENGIDIGLYDDCFKFPGAISSCLYISIQHATVNYRPRARPSKGLKFLTNVLQGHAIFEISTGCLTVQTHCMHSVL